MATAIILILLIVICIFSVKSYMKKLAHGCCGTGGDDEKVTEIKTDMSEYKFKVTPHNANKSRALFEVAK